VRSPGQVSDMPAGFSVESLAEALFRLKLPETQKIIKLTSFKQIESDENRCDVARRLALISQKNLDRTGLEEVIKQLNIDMGGLDSSLVNCLVFMKRAFEQWQSVTLLDPMVKSVFVKRRFIFAALLMDQPEFVIDTQHPVNQLLTAIEKMFMGWKEQQGKPPAFASKSLAAVTHLLHADHVLSREQQTKTRDTLYEEWAKESVRRKNLEARQIQMEVGIDNAQFAGRQAELVLHEAAHQKELPAAAAHLLRGSWFDMLRNVGLRAGSDSEEFRHLQNLTKKIVFCYQGKHRKEQQQRLFSYAGQIVDEISGQLTRYNYLDERVRGILQELDLLLIDVLKGTAIPREKFCSEIVAISDNEEGPELTGLTAKQFQGLRFIRFGKICKFLTVLPKSRHILWSDFNGRKAGTEPFGEFIRDFKSEKASLVEKQIRIQDIFLQVAKDTVKLDQEERQRQQQTIIEQKELRKAARIKAETEAKAIIAAKQAAAQKIQQESQELETRIAQEALAEEEKKRLEKEKAARSMINALPLGGLIMLDKCKQKIRCKLGVRLNATGKLIFVDNFGMKIAEMLRDEAVQLILSNKLEILGEDGDFDERLSRVVGRIGLTKR